jgi:hypothetical protein
LGCWLVEVDYTSFATQQTFGKGFNSNNFPVTIDKLENNCSPLPGVSMMRREKEMNSMHKKSTGILVFVVIISLCSQELVFAQSTVVDQSASDIAMQQTSMNVLGSVFGIDTSKYNISGGISLPCNYEQRMVVYTLESKSGNISAQFVYVNGVFGSCKLTFLSKDTTPIYLVQPAQTIIDQTQTALANYEQLISQTYSADTSYLQPMQTSLSSINSGQSTETKVGNNTLSISIANNITSISYTFGYGKGVSIGTKLQFTNGVLTYFCDTWRTCQIGGQVNLSEDQAIQIALKQAQNQTFPVTNGTNTVEIKPDLSNTIITSLFLTALDTSSSVYYPVWEVDIYFKSNLYGYIGVEELIRADTGQFFNYGFLGYHGTSDPTETQDSTSQPTPTSTVNVTEVPTVSPTALPTTAMPTTQLTTKNPLTSSDIQNAAIPFCIVATAFAVVAIASLCHLRVKKRKKPHA